MKRKLVRISIVLFLLALPLVAWRIYLARVINQQLTQVRAAGLPTNGEELNQWYPAVPDNQNAALVLTQAFALRQLYPDTRSNLVFKFKLPKRGQALSREQTDLLEGYVALNEARLKKADEALQLPASRYPIDCTKLMDTLLPHLGWLKEIAELHQFKAHLELESGNGTSASSNIVTILALARTLHPEPCLISQVVKLKLIDMAFATLERRAAASAFSLPEAQNLSAAFAQADPAGSVVHGLIGDRAMTIPYFRMTRAEADKIRPPGGDESRKDSPLPYNGPAILRLIGYYELDYGSYLIGMNKALVLLSNSPPENLRASGYLFRAGEGSKKRQRPLSAQVFSGYAGLVWRKNESIARQRLALTALAIENFRNENGRLPEDLDELVPRFLVEVSEDPFVGIELEYRRTEKGYVIYSVGRDREDNDGLEQSDKKQSDDKKSFDITFTVDR